MAVSAVQKSDNSNTRNASYLKSGVIGTLTGYSLKYLIPVTSQEKDEFYNAAVDEIETKAQKTRLNAIKAFAPQVKSEIESTDKFVRMCNNSDLTHAELNAKINLSENVTNLIHQVNNKGKEVVRQGMESLNATVKSIRPTSVFVLAGVSIGIGAALVQNVSNRIAEEKIKAIKAEIKSESEPKAENN